MTNALVQPDPGLYIWTILTFIVLVYLLRRYAWTPLLDALERREKLISSAVEDAQKTKAELQQVKQESEQLLAEARREGQDLVSRARADAERLRTELRTKATEEAATLTRNAEREIQHETRRAVQQLREEAVDISLEIASKLLRRNVSKEDNDALIQEFVDQLDDRPQQH